MKVRRTKTGQASSLDLFSPDALLLGLKTFEPALLQTARVPFLITIESNKQNKLFFMNFWSKLFDHFVRLETFDLVLAHKAFGTR